MKKKRIRKAIGGLFCAICVLLALVFAASVAFLVYAVSQADENGGLSLFGCTVFLNDSDDSLAPYPPGSAIVVRDVPVNELARGDRIVCRAPDVSGRLYPVIRVVYLARSGESDTVLAETPAGHELIEVDRADVVGKCLFGSEPLGVLLRTLRNPRDRVSLLWLTAGGLLALFFFCLLWFIFLGRRNKKRSRTSEAETSVPLKDLIEVEEIPLFYEEPSSGVRETPEEADETLPERESAAPEESVPEKAEPGETRAASPDGVTETEATPPEAPESGEREAVSLPASFAELIETESVPLFHETPAPEKNAEPK